MSIIIEISYIININSKMHKIKSAIIFLFATVDFKPLIQLLGLGKSRIHILAVQHYYVNAIFITGKTGSCWKSLSCFYPLPSFLKELVGVVPDFCFVQFFKIVSVGITLIFLSVHDFSEFLIIAGVFAKLEHILSSGEVQNIGQSMRVSEGCAIQF